MKQPNIAKALLFLEQQQAASGAFMGSASSSADDFSAAQAQPTIFFTSLILQCLRTVPGGQLLRTGMAEYLLAQRSQNWTWNYWQRDSVQAQENPYPDDLDDTCCSLAALTGYDRSLIDGSVLGALSKYLVSCETALGGPYQTWLIDTQTHPSWHNIDLAVNANIGYCLWLHSVSVPGLVEYVDAILETGTITSAYYCGTLPIVYFLARWYRGKQLPKLKQYIIEQLADYHTKNALDLALIISAAQALTTHHGLLKQARDRLINLQQPSGSWPAAALYEDPRVDGVHYYAGSEALTTAFALEALQASHYQPGRSLEPDAALKPSYTVRALAYHDIVRIEDSGTRSRYQSQLRSISNADATKQIGSMGRITARALAYRLPYSMIDHLNQASINGWVAYGIYDDLWDSSEPQTKELLGVANIALRNSLYHFRMALPDNPAFQSLVDHSFITVDSANTWELLNARARRYQDYWSLRLPDYGNLHQLAERSWGHSLAAQAVLHASGLALESPQLQALRRFFKHYLIARQLNDDAHDWEEDLAAGHLSAVVCMLLKPSMDPNTKRPFRYYPARDLAKLQQRFWEQTIDDVTNLIYEHIALATKALRDCGFKHPQAYAEWLSQLSRAADEALLKRRESQKFMQAYSGETT